MSTDLIQWPAILAITSATYLVLILAIWARRSRLTQAAPAPGFQFVRSWSAEDWTADLPTTEIPIVDPEPHHSSPSQSLRERCTMDTPIFAALAHELDLEQMLATS